MSFTQSSFIDKYLDKNRLSAISDKAKETLARLEQEVQDNMSVNGGDYEECVKQFGPQLADLAQRLSEKLKTFSIKSISDAIEAIKFAKNLGFEIYQIVDSVKDCVMPTPLPAEEAKQRQVSFGKDLAYFVWMTADPLAGRLGWIPFKKTLEMRLVKWIAGMAIELAYDVFEKNAVSKAAVGQPYLKAL